MKKIISLILAVVTVLGTTAFAKTGGKIDVAWNDAARTL